MRTTRNSGEIGANLAAASIVALGLILSCHYAIQTPVWQYPDEPAHYNYGFALASTGQLVEIKAGDWGLQSLPGAWDWPANSGSPAMSHGYLRSLFLGLTLVEVVYYNLTYIQAQGRYLFPALPGLAALMAVGWRELLFARLRPAAYLFASIALVALNFVAIYRYIVPALTQ